MTENLVERLAEARSLADEQFRTLLTTDRWDADLFAAADRVRRAQYGTDVFIRGLIEFTNYCKNDCYYCGIRHGNRKAARYRLTQEQILACCAEGYALGFRTFVLQGGEDPYFTDDRLCAIVAAIRRNHPDCAITLSVGERSHESYRRLFEAGANRYLLRHETADPAHYSRLHPANLRAENRQACLFDLKSIGYQVGAGFMVGSPYQTTDNLIADLRFLEKLQPDMIGIGPYITHAETPFAGQKNGSLELTLRLLAILRLMFPTFCCPRRRRSVRSTPRAASWGSRRARMSSCRTSRRPTCARCMRSTRTRSAPARRPRSASAACAAASKAPGIGSSPPGAT